MVVTLEECNLGDTDKGSNAHNYLPLYERHLEPDRIEQLTEIGVYNGGSLRMWRRWLPNARITGIDIEPANYVVDDKLGEIEFIEGDATQMRPWFQSDVIIDDGSHHGDEQVEVLRRFWPSLTSGGWYVIEDLASVWGKSFREGWYIWGAIGNLLTKALQGKPYDVAEVHAYEQILFVKKR